MLILQIYDLAVYVLWSIGGSQTLVIKISFTPNPPRTNFTPLWMIVPLLRMYELYLWFSECCPQSGRGQGLPTGQEQERKISWTISSQGEHSCFLLRVMAFLFLDLLSVPHPLDSLATSYGKPAQTSLPEFGLSPFLPPVSSCQSNGQTLWLLSM